MSQTKIDISNLSDGVISALSVPKITGIDYPGDDTAADPAGGQTVTITGTGFVAGGSVYIDGTVVGVTTVISGYILTFVTPAKTAGTYELKIVNPDGGLAISATNIQYSGTPVWSTPSGSLGELYELSSINYSLSATSDSNVSYTVTSGTLVAGGSLNSSSGAITGNTTAQSGSTTYNFTVDAIDQELQNTSRNFSVTVNPDVVTWSSPANNTTYTNAIGDSLTINLSAVSAAGRSISYTANTLPAGLSLSGNVISGNVTTAQTVTSLITATANTTNKSATRTLNFTIASLSGQQEYTTPGTYSWVAPAGVTSVCVVCVGGGGAGFSSTVNSNLAGGGGAGLGWKNNIAVTPGQSYTVVVGQGGRQSSVNGSTTNAQDSYFIQANTNLYATGKGGGSATAATGGTGGSRFGDGGGNGGNGAVATGTQIGGGGAGGYSGNGGNATNTSDGGNPAPPGGGGGGGGRNGNGGGGVGIYGQGASGGQWGEGGSGGTSGGFFGASGSYGGGGSQNRNQFYSNPADGAVRIIWGPGRAFPSTNTANV